MFVAKEFINRKATYGHLVSERTRFNRTICRTLCPPIVKIQAKEANEKSSSC